METATRTKHGANVLKWNAMAAKKAGPRDGKLTAYTFDGVRGLALFVTPNNVGTYYFRYKAKVGGKWVQRKIKLGRREEVSLQDAREMAEAKARDVREAGNQDIAAVAKEAKKRTAKASTFEDIFFRRMNQDDKLGTKTKADYKLVVKANKIFDELDGPAQDITTTDVSRVLRDIEQRSAHTAHKVRCALGSTFKWARRQGLVVMDPTAGLGFTVQSKPREVRLSDGELKSLWSTVDASVGAGLSKDVALIIKLMILTGQRKTNVVRATRDEFIDLDGKRPRWQISASKMKVHRDQVVPLSCQAVTLVKEALVLNEDKGSPYLFPTDDVRRRLEGSMKRTPHIHGESVSRAMARLRKRAGLGDVVAHDMRKVVVTWLREESMVSEDIAAAILHHAPKTVTGKHYDFSRFEGPVRNALQAWADHVWRVSGQAETNTMRNVVPIHAAS